MAKQFDLGRVVGGAPIDDVTPSSTNVYSSQKVEQIASSLSQQITGLKPDLLPKVAATDSGKFLRVDSAGKWAAETLVVWTGGEY